jgi:hypothetical protein
VFNNDLSKSFNKISNKGKLYFQYKENSQKTEQYLLKQEQFPQKSPSPTTYFKVKREVFNKDKSKFKGELNKSEEKSNYVDRKKIDKKVFKRLKSYVF